MGERTGDAGGLVLIDRPGFECGQGDRHPGGEIFGEGEAGADERLVLGQFQRDLGDRGGARGAQVLEFGVGAQPVGLQPAEVGVEGVDAVQHRGRLSLPRRER